MAQSKLITDLVALVTPNNDDVMVIVDNTTNPSQSVTKKISYANLKESLQDMINLFVSGGTGINAAYSDSGNTLTLSVVPDSTTQRIVFSSGGSIVGTRPAINAIPGANIVFSGEDNPTSNRIDWTIGTTAVSSGTNLAASGTTYDVLSSVSTLGDGTKDLRFRTLKAGSSKTTINYSDAGNAVSIDIDPSQIGINDLSITSPLAIAQGGTAATTASGARANLGAARAGINTDITALSGLTTALSIGQGGTNATTAQLALRNLQGLKYTENVGTVGESLVVNGAALVSNEYRTELRGVKAGSSRASVTTDGNDIAIDVNANNVLNDASADINFNGYKLTNVGAPVSSTDVATKAYTDSVAQGLTVKEAVVAATTANIVGTYVVSGRTFTVTATGTPSIDGVNITATGTRVLFKDQSTGSQNGIYTLTTSGSAGVSAIFTRATDSDTSTEVRAGSFCFVLSGSTNASKQFVQTIQNPTLDSTALAYTVLVDTTIPNGSVDNSKLASMPALTIKGAVVSGSAQDLTADQVVSIINSGSTSQLNAARVQLSGYATLTGATFTGPVSLPSGSSVSGFAQLASAQTFSAAQRGSITSLTGSGLVTPNFALSNNFSLNITAATTLAFPSGVVSGQSGAIRFVQNGTFVVSYSGAGWDFPNGTVPSNTTTSGASDLLVYYAHSNSGITAQLLTNIS